MESSIADEIIGVLMGLIAIYCFVVMFGTWAWSIVQKIATFVIQLV